MYKTLLEQAKELLNQLEQNPSVLNKFQKDLYFQELKKAVIKGPWGGGKKSEQYYRDLTKAKIDVEDKHIEGIVAQNPDFFKNIASHHNLHPELQKVLAGSNDNDIIEPLSLNPNATTETLDILSRSHNSNVLHNVAKHQNTHKETQIKLYHHPSVEENDPQDVIHYGLAQNINLIPELQNLMANQLNYGRIQKFLKRNPNITKEAKEIMEARRAQKEAYLAELGYNKSEAYYKNLVKSELAKAKIIDFKTRQTLADEGGPLLSSPAKGKLTGIQGGKPGKAGQVKPNSILEQKVKDLIDDLAEKQALMGSLELKQTKTQSLKPEKPKKSLKSTPENHLKAALHHATWWAGHQGMHDQMLNTDWLEGNYDWDEDQDSYVDEEGNPLDNEETARSFADETGHMGKANDHLEKAKAHLKMGGFIDKSGNFDWTRPELENVISNPHSKNLLYLIKDAEPNVETSHIWGTHISHYGPTGVHSHKDTKDDYISSYAHEGNKGDHPLDVLLTKPDVSAKKSEQYYRNLVKNTFEKADIYSFKTKKKIASLPSKETAKEAQPIVRGKEKGITNRKYLKQTFSPDIMPEEKEVPGGTEVKKK